MISKDPNNFSSSSLVKDAEMITGKVDATPRYAYFKWLGKGFCSILGGCSTDGTGGLALSPIDSKYFLLLGRKNPSISHISLPLRSNSRNHYELG